MKNCISCSQAINDESVFCPLCGTPQQPEAVQKAGNPITAGAFLRIFRPSFFGSFERMKVKADVRDKLIVNFLCLSRDITDDEINELNMAFDILLNQPQAEYALIRMENDGANVSYVLSNKAKITIENEKFRYNFISDHLLDIIKKEKTPLENFFAIIWLLALVSVLDGQYSEEKEMLFSRIKNLFPISREDLLRHQEKNKNAHSIYGRFFAVARSASFAYEDEVVDDFENIQSTDIPEDFDFYACVEYTIQKLCALETNIQQLEQSEGKYADIKAQIEQLATEELKLTDLLPGFTYLKF